MFTLIILCSMYGCASSGPAKQDLVLDKEVNPMSRNEVILAIQECESSRMRAVMILSKRKISNHTTDVVVDVTCAPKYSYNY